MFERFTVQSRQVVVSAQDEARRVNHAHIGTEHLLLGLLRGEEGVALNALASLGVTLDGARRVVSRTLAPGDKPVEGQIPFTPQAKRVLEQSMRESIALSHNYVGTEHILLGLVGHGEGIAMDVLADFGADAETIRSKIAETLIASATGREKDRTPVRQSGDQESNVDISDEGGAATGETGTESASLPASLRIAPRAIADLAAEVDALGIQPLVQGLVELVSDPQTQLPLAIAITGEWGSGKSSVMRQMRARLPRFSGSQRGLIHRTWHTASFDAWKYERSERLWAALTRAIYDSAMDARPLWSRIWFRLRLEADRQGLAKFLAKVLLPFAPLVAAVAYLGWTSNFGRPGAWLAGLVGTAVLSAAAVERRWSGLSAFVTDPFKRAIDAHTVRPRFEEQLGFTTAAEADVRALTRLVTRKGRSGLAVFVDDLDRCSPAHVVEVVEAVSQIFSSTPDHPTLFVLGMDTDIVAASIEAAYADVLERLSPKRKTNFGYHYLRKIVQITVALPRPTLGGLRNLLSSMVGDWGESALPEETSVIRFQSVLEKAAAQRLQDVSRRAEQLAAGGLSATENAALAEATRRERARFLGSDSEDVAAAEAELLPFVAPNPRALKQFDNAFRLQLHVANETPGAMLDFSFDQLIAIGKWVALRLKWPTLAQAIDADASLLDALERAANRDAGNGTRQESGGSRVDEWLADTELAIFLVEDNAGRRMAVLPFDSFLRIA